MKILFLEIETEAKWALASMGPAYLAAHIRPHGHDAFLLRVAPDVLIPDLVREIQTRDPDILGLSLTTRQWLRAQEVVAGIRAKLDLPVIAGGIHPTVMPEAVLAAPGFDYACVGEGEGALLELLQHLAASPATPIPETPIANLCTRKHGPAPLRPPLPWDTMPVARRDLLDEPPGVIHVRTQKFCPFSCAYCSSGYYRRLYRLPKAPMRRAPEDLLAELAHVREEGPLNYVIFMDDTFTVDAKWLERFCQLYADEIGAGFSINARAETVNPLMLAMLAKAGCRQIIFGVESGSPRIRKIVLNRPMSDATLIRAFAAAHDQGLMSVANYMLGLPGETRADIEKTLALHAKLNPHDFGYFVFYPYPGTPLFELCREQGLLPAEPLSLPVNHRRSILHLTDLGRDDIEYYYQQFTRLRESNYLSRFGQRLTVSQKQEARDMIRRAAATA